MKKMVLLMVVISISHLAQAQYKLVDKESFVKFKVRNFGFEVTGSFSKIHGDIQFDAQNPSSDLFDVTIDATTVNTENGMRDEHLKGSSYFDVTNYPAIHFVSTGVSAGKAGVYDMTGKLMIRGKTQAITFPFTVNTVNDKLQFKGSFKINRKDFGVGGTSTISNDVNVLLDVTAENKTEPDVKNGVIENK
jgi:polyisoprenoid-binding protein YceI